MAEIIKFPERRVQHDKDGAWLSGEMFCRTCEHTYNGVMPVGMSAGDCPNCGAHNTVPKHTVTEDELWQCGCGNRVFILTKKGPLCGQCGIYQVQWVKQ